MSNNIIPSVLKNVEECEWTYFKGQDGREDRLRWKTLLGDDQSATKGLTYGLMELPEGRFLDAHFHADHEIYHVLQGTGVVLLDREVSEVGPGSFVYIPGNTTHGIRNTGKERLVMIWVFPNNKWNEVEYHMVDQSF